MASTLEPIWWIPVAPEPVDDSVESDRIPGSWELPKSHESPEIEVVGVVILVLGVGTVLVLAHDGDILRSREELWI